MVSDFEIFLDKISSAVNRQSPKPEEKSNNAMGLKKKKSKKAGRSLSAEASCASERIHRAEGAKVLMSELTSVSFSPPLPQRLSFCPPLKNMSPLFRNSNMASICW